MAVEKKQKRESRYPLRLPSDLYEKIQILADKNFHSVNAEMVRLLRIACDLEGNTGTASVTLEPLTLTATIASKDTPSDIAALTVDPADFPPAAKE